MADQAAVVIAMLDLTSLDLLLALAAVPVCAVLIAAITLVIDQAAGWHAPPTAEYAAGEHAALGEVAAQASELGSVA